MTCDRTQLHPDWRTTFRYQGCSSGEFVVRLRTRAVVVRVSMRETTYQERHSLTFKVAINIKAALRVHDIKRNIIYTRYSYIIIIIIFLFLHI